MPFIQQSYLCRAVEFLIHNSSNQAYNLTSFSCSQKEITQSICNIYGKKLRFFMPSIFVKAIFGQMGKELLLSSQNIKAQNLAKLGFKFEYQDCKKSIENIL